MEVEHLKGNGDTVNEVRVWGIWILLWHIHIKTSIKLLINFAYSLATGDILEFIRELVCKIVCCLRSPEKHHPEFVIWACVQKLQITRSDLTFY